MSVDHLPVSSKATTKLGLQPSSNFGLTVDWRNVLNTDLLAEWNLFTPS